MVDTQSSKELVRYFLILQVNETIEQHTIIQRFFQVGITDCNSDVTSGLIEFASIQDDRLSRSQILSAFMAVEEIIIIMFTV